MGDRIPGLLVFLGHRIILPRGSRPYDVKLPPAPNRMLAALCAICSFRLALCERPLATRLAGTAIVFSCCRFGLFLAFHDPHHFSSCRSRIGIVETHTAAWTCCGNLGEHLGI